MKPSNFLTTVNLPSRFLASVVGLCALASVWSPVESHADWLAQGIFRYTDRTYDTNGWTGTIVRPVREADVEIYDKNTLAVLGTGKTGTNGLFNFVVVDSLTRDVAVRVKSSTTQTATLNFSVVNDADSDSVFIYQDPSSDITGHGPTSLGNFGIMVMPLATGAVGSTDWSSQVFNTFDAGVMLADWVLAMEGSRPTVGYSIGWNPTNGLAESFYIESTNRLHLADDDGYDDPNILRALGRYVEQEYGQPQSIGGPHDINDRDQDPRLAFSEGFATYVANATLHMAGRDRPDVYSDRNSFTVGTSSGSGIAYSLENQVFGGGANELAINAALYDLIDTTTTLDQFPGVDDDAVSGQGTNVWMVIRAMRTNNLDNTSMEDFWDIWRNLGLGSEAALQTIFTSHKIDFLPDSSEPNNTPATATLLTIGGAYLTNTFYRSTGNPAEDEDWFEFNATNGVSYIIEVNTNNLFGRPDPQMFLFDPNLDRVVAFADDPRDDKLNDQSDFTAQDMKETIPRVLFTARTTGSYFVYLRHASEKRNLEGRYGSYEIRVREGTESIALNSMPTRMRQGQTHHLILQGAGIAADAVLIPSNSDIVTNTIWHSPEFISTHLIISTNTANGPYFLTLSNGNGSTFDMPFAYTVDSTNPPPVAISEVALASGRVEIQNRGSVPAALDGWQIVGRRTDTGTSNTYTFPPFTLPAGATVVVSENAGTDTATDLFDQTASLDWPWVDGAPGDVNLMDNGGTSMDYLRWVDSPTTEHESPLGFLSHWIQPEILVPPATHSLSRSRGARAYRSTRELSHTLTTMPVGTPIRHNAADRFEDNDEPERAHIFWRSDSLPNLEISARPVGDDDIDWFGVLIDAGDTLQINALFTNSAGNLDVELYPPGDTTTPILTGNTTDDNEFLDLTAGLSTTHGSGIYRIRVFGVGGAVNSYDLNLSDPLNTPPAILTPLPPQFVQEFLNLPFIIGDAQTGATNLTVTAFTSNPNVFTNVFIQGSGSNRLVTIVPAATNASAMISIVVSDGANTITNSFPAGTAQTVGSGTDFNNGFYSWVQDPADDGNWTLTNGPTFTLLTGPSGAFSGTNYLYTEATVGPGALGNPNRSAQLLAGLKFTSISNPAMVFAYHMHGSNIGTLSIDVFGTNWVSNVWTRTGAQQFTGGEPWRHAAVDLSPFGNMTNVLVRVRGVTGTNELSDIGFDMPVFDTNAAPQITNQMFSIRAMPTNNAPLGTVFALDPGMGFLTNFAFTNLTPSSPFAINPTNGMVIVTNPVALDLGVTNQLFFDVSVTDVLGLSNVATMTVDLTIPNDPPALLTGLPTRFIRPFVPLNIPFDIGDPESAASNLLVTAFSSDQMVIADSNIFIAGPDSNRVMTLSTPATDGSATISLVINDATNSVTNIFKVGIEHPLGVGTSFDSGLFSWVQELNDDGDWTPRIGPTPTPGTGPFGAFESPVYLYTEASMGQGLGNPNRTALLTAGLNFTNTPNPALTFAYHMFGSNMGTLSIDVFGTNWVSNVWTRVGQQHTSTNDPWTQTAVDLSAFGNRSNIQVRFRGVTGSGPASDMAIDFPFFQNNTAPQITNQSFASVDMPTNNAFLGIVNATDPGVGPLTNFMYSIVTPMSPFAINPTNGLVIVTNPAALDAGVTNKMFFDVRVVDTLGLSNTATVTVNLTFRNDAPELLSMIGDQWVKRFGVLNVPIVIGDRESSASSLVVTATSSDQSVFPDGSIFVAGTGSNRTVTLLPLATSGSADISLVIADGTNSVTNVFRAAIEPNPSTGTAFDSGLQSWLQALDDDGDWSLTNAPTATPGTGPSLAFLGTNYLYTEASTGLNPGNPNRTASIYARVDFATHTNPILSFAYHMFGTNMGNLSVDVFDGAWISNFWFRSGQQHFSASDPWTQTVVDLRPFSGKSNLLLRIRGETGNGSLSDIALDFPVVDINFPPTIAPQGFFANEMPTNPILGTVIASDLGLGPDTNFIFDILTPSSPFDINPTNGLVIVTNPAALDFENTNTLFFDVSVRDILGLSNSATMTVNLINVDEPPMHLTSIPPQFVAPFGVLNVPFVIGDIDTAASNLVVTASSSDQSVFLDGGMFVSGSGSNRTLTLLPLATSGSAIISLVVSDGTTSVTNTFQAALEQRIGIGTSFDNGRLSWLEALDDDLDWTLNNGPTPTLGTGPSGALFGTNYLFTEATGNPNRTASLLGGLNLSNRLNPAMTFAYHMFGSNMGSLSIDVFDTVWISNYWTRSGPQHFSSADPWTEAVVDLSPFANKSNLQIRVRGVTGPGDSSDIGFDFPLFHTNAAPQITPQAFGINEMPPTNALLGFVNAFDPGSGPLTNFNFNITTPSSPFAINPTNGLVIVTNPFALDFEITNTLFFDVSVVDILGLSNSATMTVNLNNVDEPPMHLTSIPPQFVGLVGFHSVNFNIGDIDTHASNLVVTAFSSDQMVFQDSGMFFTGSGSNRTLDFFPAATSGSATISIVVSDGTTSVTNTFQAAIKQQLGLGTPFDLGRRSWLEDLLFDDFGWLLNNGPTPTVGTGPSGAFFGTNYLFTEATGNPNRTAQLLAGLDLTNAINPAMTFAYHMFGSDMGSLSVDVFDGSWNSNIWTRSGQQHLSSAAPWTQAAVDLSPFANKSNLIVRVRGITGPGEFSDIGFDFPVFQTNGPPQLSPQVFGLPETPTNALMAILALDPGIGPLTNFTFGFPSPSSPFAINPTNGHVTVTNPAALNFEVTNQMFFDVSVVDIFGLSNSATMTVNIMDVNERPVVTNQTFSINENSANATPVGTVIASDQDSGTWGQLHYDIIAGNGSGIFAINTNNGAISVADGSQLNFEAAQNHFLTVRVTDGGSVMIPGLFADATITVQVNDLNEPPMVTDQMFSIDENSTNNTSIGFVTTSDLDAGANGMLGFAITAGNTGSAFAIHPTSGELTVANTTALNFEAISNFNLTITVMDGGAPALSDTAMITINVNNLNDPPVIDDQGFVINEDLMNGALVGMVSSSDQDAGANGNLHYLITGGNASGAFAINTNNGSITVANAAALNFEVTNSFVLSVQVNDGATPPLVDSGSVTITINDVNEAPSLADQAFTIDENSTNATLVATLMAVDDDAGINGNVVYEIIGGSGQTAFSVDFFNGQVFVADEAQLDFEASPSLDIIVRVTDGGTPGLTNAATITFNLNNVNDTPEIADQSLSVAENSPNSTPVGTIVASDDDSGTDGTLIYTIISGNETGAFSLNSANGAVSVANSALLNFEAVPSYALQIRVTDGGIPALSETATVTVNILDVNEAPIIGDRTMVLNENSPNTTLVGTVTGTDVDGGASGNLTYDFAAGNELGAFAIGTTDGAITVADATKLNFESNPSFTLTVRVTDGGTPTLTDTATVTVNLVDLNEVPAIADVTFAVDENASAMAVVGTALGSDPDSGSNGALSHSITAGNTGGAFGINPTTGVITVATPSALNFETNPTFTLTVQVSDGGTPSLNDTATVTINLNDLNEPPTIADATYALDENSPAMTPVGTPVSSDPDSGANGTLGFAITSGNASGAFAINPTSGAITVANATPLDFETTANFVLTVEITDGGTPALSDTATITVNLNDVNETPSAPNATFAVNENSPAGIGVGSVNGSDPDAGDNGIVSYIITDGNSSGAFAINPGNGDITVNSSAPLNFESTTSFTLTVQVSDRGTPRLTADATITINVNDLNEAPTADNATFALNENSPASTPVGSVVANDVDAGANGTLSYAILAGNASGAFAIANDGSITVADATPLDFENNPSFNLTIQVTDGGTPGLLDTALVTVNLADLNEAPTLADILFTLDENSANGAPVGTLSGSDQDAGVNGMFLYGILSGNESGAFALDANSGAITVADSSRLNFEASPTFTLAMSITDGGTPALSDTATVTINLNDINEVPILPTQTFTFNENLALGSIIGNVGASDPDAGPNGTLSYSLTNVLNELGLAIEPFTGDIFVNDPSVLNFETRSNFNFDVVARDGGNPPLEIITSFAAILRDVNEAPSIPDGFNGLFALPENSANGSLVGTLPASDPDAGDLNLIYEAIFGNDHGAFALDTNSGAITVADSSQLNFEATPTFTLGIRVSDDGTPPLSDTATVTINLNDLNEVPILPTRTFTFNENLALGSIIGNVGASDPDTGPNGTLSHSLTNVLDLLGIDIEPLTGDIFVDDPSVLDFETRPNFSFDVVARDGGNPALETITTFTAVLIDLNEAPSIPNALFALPENSTNSTPVGTLSGSDQDAGVNGTVSYGILSGNESGAFALDPNSGAITVADSSLLNFEASPSFTLSVQIADGGTPSLTDTATVTINLNDLNEVPLLPTRTFTFDENLAAGMVIGNVGASDPDAGLNGTLSYSLTNLANPLGFDIDPVTGDLIVDDPALLDFETRPTFNFDVVARDGGNPFLEIITTFNAVLNDLNEAPTLEDFLLALDENSANSSPVGTLFGSDQDTGVNGAVTYGILSGNESGAFALDPNSGAITVADSSLLNFEASPSFTLSVQIADGGTPSLTDTATVTINLNDLNETPSLGDLAVNLAENQPNGFLVGNAPGSDPDTGSNGTLTYSITDGNDSGAFAIDPASGAVTIADTTKVDFETVTSFALTLMVSDGGTPALTDTGTFTVNVQDVNETPVINDTNFPLAENEPLFALVGTVSGTDQDAGANGSLLYTIVGGNASGAFIMSQVSGNITVADPAQLDFETNPTFALTVRATDGGNPALSDDAIVNIALTDLNEAPVATNSTVALDENTANQSVIGSAGASDPDAGPNGSLTYSIASGNDSGAFAIDAASGQITVADSAQLNFEAITSFVLGIVVSDGGTPPLTDSATFTINLNDVNEAPTADDAIFALDENSSSSTAVGTITAADVDAGANGDLTFLISAGNDDGTFALDAASGVLTVSTSTSLDFEQSPVFTLTIEVQDGGTPALSDTLTATVNLNDLNESPTLGDQSFNVDENSANQTLVGTISGVDPDGGVNGTLTYAITAGNDSGAFAIDSASGAISIADSTQLNFETTTSFTLTVEASDGGTPSLSDTATVSIAVNDVNESPAANDLTKTVDENRPVGTFIGTVLATDPDAGDAGTLSYEITAGDPNNAFTIDAGTGVITVADQSALNFEVNQSFTLTVTVSDAGTPALADTATVNITINDLNESPSVGDATFAIDENSAAMTALGSVTGNDPDAGPNGTLSYTINSGNIGGAFAIAPDTGAITVADQTALNFEVTPAFALTITVTDGGTPALLDTATVNITVNDLNEQPRAFPGTMTTIENALNNATLGIMLATDEDRGQNGVLRYSIVGGNGATALAVDPVSGTISVQDSAQLDFEANPTLEIVVQAADQGTPSLTDTNTMTLHLIDLNEAPTVDDQTFSVDENSPIGTAVATVAATDPDAGFNGTLRYAITAGNQFGTFAIDANSGVISVASSTRLNYEVRTNFTFSVTVTDSGIPTFTDSAQITINVNDVNETPGVLRPFAPMLITTVPTTIVSNLTLNFADIESPSEQLTYTISQVSNSDLLTAVITDATNLTVTVNSGFTGTGTIMLRATDPQGLFVETPFEISVPSLVDPPALTIERVGANIRISWPSTEVGWIVESRPFASPAPPWTAESSLQLVFDGRTQVEITISGPGRFYRLRRQ